jgi:uncharacterized protein (TIGR00730 family)
VAQPPKIISVFGGSRTAVGSPDYEEARTTGRLLAEAGFVTMTGGYNGTMEAVSRGAKEAGGRVIGVTISLFDSRRLSANAWVDEEIKKPDYISRVHHLVQESDGYIALRGGVGTLTEVSLTWSLIQVEAIAKRPLICVGERWKRALRDVMKELVISREDLSLLLVVDTPEEAVEVLGSRLLRQ